MPDTKGKGELSQLAIMLAVVEAGGVPCPPFGDNQRYDLIVDAFGTLKRVQCKTAWVNKKSGALEFNTRSTTPSTMKSSDYRGEVDFFSVYSPDTRRVYLVDIEETGTASICLRVDPPKNGQKKGIRMAEDYLLTTESLKKVMGS